MTGVGTCAIPMESPESFPDPQPAPRGRGISGARFLELAGRGDYAEAHDLLVRLTGPLARCLTCYAAELGGDQEVDGLVHAAIERALHRWDHYRAERGELGAWLFRIGINLTRSHLRSLRTRRLMEARASRQKGEDPRRAQLQETVSTAIQRLPKKLRDVVVLDLQHGGTARAEVIARELGLATQTVLNRRSLARQRLRPILEELLP